MRFPIKWTRVHNLPDFVYFPHDIHVNKGIACVTCHGAGGSDAADVSGRRACRCAGVCDCHRNPEEYLRPRDQVFNMEFTIDDKVKRKFSDSHASGDGSGFAGQALIDLYHIPTDGRITNCYTCHR